MTVKLLESGHWPAAVACCGRPLPISFDYSLDFPGRKVKILHNIPGTEKVKEHLFILMVQSYLGANCFPQTATLINQLFFLKSTKLINIPQKAHLVPADATTEHSVH